MRVLVTGAAGFIGGHLARTLATEGHDVVALDLLDRADTLGTSERITCMQADIRDTAAVAAAVRGAGAVFHEAAVASVPESFVDPARCMSVNVEGSAIVLEQSRLAGVRRVVMASTSAVYGDDPTPFKHEGLTPAPRSPYAVSKLAMEQLADVYARQYGMETVALRYFNVYGPGQPAEGGYAAVIPAIRRSARTGVPMPVYGDGEQTRSFIYIDDVVRANLLAMDAPIRPDDGVAIANLAGAETVSLNALLEVFGQHLGKSVDTVTMPEREGDIKHSAGDSSRAQELLGFEAQILLHEGVRRLLASPD